MIDRINHITQATMSREKVVMTPKRGFSYQQVKVAIDQHSQAHEPKSNIQIKAEKADWQLVLKYACKGKGLTAIQQELRQRKIDTTELPQLGRPIN